MSKIRMVLLSFVCRGFSKAIAFLYQRSGPSLTQEGKFLSPIDFSLTRSETAQFLRIDIGLSDDASHSVDCLFDADNRMIIGIEPHPGNLRGLRFGVPKFHSMSTRDKIIRKGNNVKNIPDLEKRFVIIQGAAGSSDAPIERTFYSAYPDKGNSSLYKIQTPKSTGNIVDQEFNVLEFPLSLLFPEIDKAGFSFVESLKIDTEGHDLEVLKGAGLEIKKVLFCRVECFKGIYENSQYADPKAQPDHIVLGADGYHDSASAIVDYLKTFNFKLVSSRPGDYVFLNLDLEHLLTEYELYP